MILYSKLNKIVIHKSETFCKTPYQAKDCLLLKYFKLIHLKTLCEVILRHGRGYSDGRLPSLYAPSGEKALIVNYGVLKGKNGKLRFKDMF